MIRPLCGRRAPPTTMMSADKQPSRTAVFSPLNEVHWGLPLHCSYAGDNVPSRRCVPPVNQPGARCELGAVPPPPGPVRWGPASGGGGTEPSQLAQPVPLVRQVGDVAGRVLVGRATRTARRRGRPRRRSRSTCTARSRSRTGRARACAAGRRRVRRDRLRVRVDVDAPVGALAGAEHAGRCSSPRAARSRRGCAAAARARAHAAPIRASGTPGGPRPAAGPGGRAARVGLPGLLGAGPGLATRAASTKSLRSGWPSNSRAAAAAPARGWPPR